MADEHRTELKAPLAVYEPPGGTPPIPEWPFPLALGTVDDDATPPDVAIDPEDDATIFYTSGTTGRPKGAVGHAPQHGHEPDEPVLPQHARLHALRHLAARRGGPEPTDRVQPAMLLSVPLFHATGCHSIMVTNTAAGGKIVMMHHFDPDRALELIEREKIGTFGGVPAMVMQVLDSPNFSKYDTSSVRGVSYGGAPAPPDLVRRIREAWPVGQPSNGYGLTETSSVTSMNAGGDYVAKPDSVGPPVPGVRRGDRPRGLRQGRARRHHPPRPRRARRAVDQGPQRRPRLLAPARGDGQDVLEGLAPHRRRGPAR